MLHDLRKLVATVGEKLGISDAVLRRIPNHTAPRTDVLHRHYVGLSDGDVAVALAKIQPSWLLCWEALTNRPRLAGSACQLLAASPCQTVTRFRPLRFD